MCVCVYWEQLERCQLPKCSSRFLPRLLALPSTPLTRCKQQVFLLHVTDEKRGTKSSNKFIKIIELNL